MIARPLPRSTGRGRDRERHRASPARPSRRAAVNDCAHLAGCGRSGRRVMRGSIMTTVMAALRSSAPAVLLVPLAVALSLLPAAAQPPLPPTISDGFDGTEIARQTWREL